MATNQTPVEYCRHENCGKVIEKCKHEQENCDGCKGYVHLDRLHCCNFPDSSQVAEPADPPQQQTLVDAVLLAQEPDGKNTLGYNYPVKAGTQMEERKPDVEQLLREEFWNRHGCNPSARYGDDGEMQCGKCITDFKRMPIDALIDRVGRLRLKAAEKAMKNAVSESANREPQGHRERFLLEVIQDLRDRKAKSERKLQELRAQNEWLLANFCDAHKQICSASSSACGICEAASLRGLVGRMLMRQHWAHRFGGVISCRICDSSVGSPLTAKDVYHKPTCLISEAEAAIKEPH